jgi:hypothetical protein
VPLRFPRPVMALIAAGAATVSLCLIAVPASADAVRHQEWWLSSLGVTSAWSASQGAGVTVAVLSDGVDASQADLAGAVTTSAAIVGAPVAFGQYAGEQGTPIASLIAGRGHGSGSGAGIIGVAPEARILSVPVTLPPDDPQLGQTSVAAAIPAAIAAGIRYAVSHGATVIDLPIDPGQAGSNGIAGMSAAAGGSAAEQAAISYAAAHNVVLIAPAGDDETAGDAPNYPAAYPGVIAVGAFDSAFDKAPWSSRQSYVTLTAAGVGVIAADNAGSYQAMNSTSAASAIVAGVVALIRSRYPSLTAADIRKALITTTLYRRPDGLAIGSGYGAVDAGQAMTAAAAMATPPSDRASAGAQPLKAPAAVPAPSATKSMGTQLVRAGELSGGLLVVLLLLIGSYVATVRRRRRRRPAVTTEWTHRQAQSRYPQAGGADADRMLEVFAAPSPAPALQSGRHGVQSIGASGLDNGPFDYVSGRQGAIAPGGQLVPDGPVVSASVVSAAGTGDGARWQSHSPASRAVSRRPAVSSAPPWEPASVPDTELPWTAAATPGRRGPGEHGGASGPHSLARPATASPMDESAPAVLAAGEQLQPPAGPAAQSPFYPTSPAGPSRSYGPPSWDAPGRTSQPGWHRADRSGQADREIAPGGLGSAADSSAAPWVPQWSASPAGSASPVLQPPGDSPSAAGSVSAADFSSPPGLSSSGRLGPAEYGADAAGLGGPPQPLPPSRLASSGLPVRQPRASLPASPAPLSPSGSLWEPAAARHTTRESAAAVDDSQETASRPIFVWNPSTPADSSAAEPGDSSAEPGWPG